jgi:heparinase II/III-like protein
MPTFSWYFQRLGRMSAAELAYRLMRVAAAALERWTQGVSRATPAPHIVSPPRAFVRLDPDIDPRPYVAGAQAILAGRFTVFDLEDCDLGHPPHWNRDPLTGVEAPLACASSIDHRDERIVGNIKYLWEPNRHLHLPRLAQAYALTGELRYALEVRLQVESWLDQCPTGRGPNWSSSLELAIRLINWSIAWQLLGGWDAALFAGRQGEVFRERWLGGVYQHARAIVRRLSRYSSANNHLIGEAAGVWIACVVWNCWPAMRAWGQRCKRILVQEALRQNAPDGGNREQAFAYQQFVLDFLLLSGLAARAAGEDFPADYWRRIERMMEFTAAMMDAAGHVPMIGDADDGYVVRLAAQDGFDNYRSLLASGALLFGRDDFAAQAGHLDDKTRWLLGGEDRARFAAPRVVLEPPRAFAHSGYYLLGEQLGAAGEVRLLVDAGPLGYLSLAAHGHADALSILLNIGGHEVLVDPGTYAYHTEPQWRRYFRSTRAHNTVSVDGCDQSRQSGNFMWSHHARARALRFEVTATRQRFVGEHDGYRRLADPVLHRREILYEPASKRFSVADMLQCQGAHEVFRHWHFAETLQPIVAGHEIHVDVGQCRVRLVPAEPPGNIECHHGASAAQGGWVSRRFGRKVAATSIVWRSSIQGTMTLRTHIFIENVVPGDATSTAQEVMP